jgi:23S rRNA-/tRNA-specific pseudouridylate synthase
MAENAQFVAEDESGIRLDRWFKRRYPALTHGRLEKLLRTGQVRLDGKRAWRQGRKCACRRRWPTSRRKKGPSPRQVFPPGRRCRT